MSFISFSSITKKIPFAADFPRFVSAFPYQADAERLMQDPPELKGPGKLLPSDIMCISWALSLHAPFEPLVIFSRASLLYVYSVPRNSILGYIRGHGGASFFSFFFPTRNFALLIHNCDRQLHPLMSTL